MIKYIEALKAKKLTVEDLSKALQKSIKEYVEIESAIPDLKLQLKNKDLSEKNKSEIERAIGESQASLTQLDISLTASIKKFDVEKAKAKSARGTALYAKRKEKMEAKKAEQGTVVGKTEEPVVVTPDPVVVAPKPNEPVVTVVPEEDEPVVTPEEEPVEEDDEVTEDTPAVVDEPKKKGSAKGWIIGTVLAVVGTSLGIAIHKGVFNEAGSKLSNLFKFRK